MWKTPANCYTLTRKKMTVLHRWPLGSVQGAIRAGDGHKNAPALCCLRQRNDGRGWMRTPGKSDCHRQKTGEGGLTRAAFDPGTKPGVFVQRARSGTLTVVHEDAPDKYSVVENVPRRKSGAAPMALDLKTAHAVNLAVRRNLISAGRRGKNGPRCGSRERWNC